MREKLKPGQGEEGCIRHQGEWWRCQGEDSLVSQQKIVGAGVVEEKAEIKDL